MKRRLVLLGGLAWSLSGLLASPGAAPAGELPRLAFAELYKTVGVLGLQLSDRTRELAGKPVVMRGFMAPPLKPEADFFVLTREPVALCPFCQSDADWPADIIVVYMRSGARLTGSTDRIEVTGTFEVGSRTDPKTGFVSQLRILDGRWRKL